MKLKQIFQNSDISNRSGIKVNTNMGTDSFPNFVVFVQEIGKYTLLWKEYVEKAKNTKKYVATSKYAFEVSANI